MGWVLMKSVQPFVSKSNQMLSHTIAGGVLMKRKRVIYSMVALLAVFFAVNTLHYQVKVEASSIKKEAEDNDSFQKANPLKTNQSIKGRMNSADDQDYFKYKVDTQGCFKFEVENISGSDDVGYGWNWHVYDMDFHELCYCNYFKSKQDSFIYNFKKGTVVYIMVESNYQNSDVINAAYKITVKTKKSADWEVEGNDSSKSATQLDLNKKKYGSIYISNDQDYYEYKVKENGPLKFRFENESEKEYCGYGWEIKVYDSKMNELETMRTKSQVESKIFSYKRGSKLYLKVSSLYHDSDAANLKYSLCVKTKKNRNWEQEENNSYATADKIQKKSVKYGTIMNGNDVDYYKYIPDESRKASLTFSVKENEAYYGWNVSIYNSAKKVVASSEGIKSTEKLGWKTEKSQTYYIVVSPKYSDADTADVKYSIQIR